MRKPRVSIGMPVYNASRYLRLALESLLAQTHADFEIVLCDNASTDATADICREFAARDRRVRYHRNPQNLGVVKNFNLAFELSRGRYFKWAAYDDLHAPTFLQRTAALLDASPDIAVAIGRVRRIDAEGLDQGPFPQRWFFDVPRASERFRRVMWTDSFPEIWGLMRSEQLRRTRLFGALMGADRNFLAELFLQGRAGYVPEDLFLLRDHPGSYTSSAIDYGVRLSWYAPLARIPSWMQVPATFMEYAAAIRRSPVNPRVKLVCAAHLAQWGLTCAGGVLARRLGQLLQLPFNRKGPSHDLDDHRGPHIGGNDPGPDPAARPRRRAPVPVLRN